MTKWASLLTRPATRVGPPPSTANASRATASGRIGKAEARLLSGVCSRKFGVEVAPATIASTSTPSGRSSAQSPSASTVSKALLAA